MTSWELSPPYTVLLEHDFFFFLIVVNFKVCCAALDEPLTFFRTEIVVP